VFLGIKVKHSFFAFFDHTEMLEVPGGTKLSIDDGVFSPFTVMHIDTLVQDVKFACKLTSIDLFFF